MFTLEIFEKPNGEIFEVNGSDSTLCMRLPNDATYSMALSGWLYSRFSNAKLDASLEHYVDIGDGIFIPFDQFTLVREGAMPLFKATGTQANIALEILKQAFDSFNPDDFDTDGYSINHTA